MPCDSVVPALVLASITLNSLLEKGMRQALECSLTRAYSESFSGEELKVLEVEWIIGVLGDDVGWV